MDDGNPQTLLSVLKEAWHLVVATIATLVWLVRLEGRTNANERAAQTEAREREALERRLMAQRAEDQDAAKESRQEVKDALKDIRDDIKKILERLGSGQ